MGIKRAHIITRVFTAIVFAAVALVFLLPAPVGLKIFATNVLLLVAATVIFGLGLKGFRDRLKTTYLFICASMLLFAAGLIQVTILNGLNATGSAYAVLGGATAPYIIMSVLAYLGVRILAGQTLVKSILLNTWFTLGLAIIVGLLTVLLPTPRADVAAYVVHIAVGLSATVVVIVGATATLLVNIMGQVSALYKTALGWLGFYYGTITVAIVANTVAQQYVSPSDSPQVYLVGYIIFGLAAILALVAALSFNRIAHAEDDIIKSKKYKTSSSVDVVVCLALLVSNPKSVDHILDSLRALTSSLSSNAPADQQPSLTDEQQATTAHIYLQIEDFLVNQEPVRKFTREQLRQMINIKFKDAVQEPAFWQKLNSGGA